MGFCQSAGMIRGGTMKNQKRDKALDVLVSTYFKRMARSLAEDDRFEWPSVSAHELGRVFDWSFARPELIDNIVALLKQLRAKLPRWPTAAEQGLRFDSRVLENIAESGFVGAYEGAADKDAIATLYNRMLLDETLLLDAHYAILGAQELSSFWEVRMFAPNVRLLDFGTGTSQDIHTNAEHGTPRECPFSIDGDSLVAKLDQLHAYAGQCVAYVLVKYDDPALADLEAAIGRPQACDAFKRQLAQRTPWASLFRKGYRHGKSQVSNDGVFVCRIENRPDSGRLMASVLVLVLPPGGR